MSRAEEVVRDFCQAFSRCDVDELLRFFAEDAVYHNIPIAAVRGKAAIEATLRQFVDPNGSAEFEIKSLASTAGTVLTERIDRFVLNGKKVELPVMGAFEVGPDGKIRAWRDYFDMAQFTSQITSGTAQLSSQSVAHAGIVSEETPPLDVEKIARDSDPV